MNILLDIHDFRITSTYVRELFASCNNSEICCFDIKESLSFSLKSKIKAQISRTKEKDSSPRNTRLYFEILKKTQNIIENYIDILEMYSEKYDNQIKT